MASSAKKIYGKGTSVFFHPVNRPYTYMSCLLNSTGRVCLDLNGPYSVSKYGVQAFSDALRREMQPWGIKVSIMEPGGFQTPIADPASVFGKINQGWEDLSEELKKEYAEKGVKLVTSLAPSPHTYKVVDSVVDALTSQSPSDRYLIGFDAQCFYAWMGRLPTALSDFIVRRMSTRLPHYHWESNAGPCYKHFCEEV